MGDQIGPEYALLSKSTKFSIFPAINKLVDGDCLGFPFLIHLSGFTSVALLPMGRTPISLNNFFG